MAWLAAQCLGKKKKNKVEVQNKEFLEKNMGVSIKYENVSIAP